MISQILLIIVFAKVVGIDGIEDIYCIQNDLVEENFLELFLITNSNWDLLLFMSHKLPVNTIF